MEECEGFFVAVEKKGTSCLDAFQASGTMQFVTGNILEAFYNVYAFLAQPSAFLAWVSVVNSKMDTDQKVSLAKFMYYGGSVEFFFFVVTMALIFLIVGLFVRRFLWRVVRTLEGFGNIIGRLAAWAGLAMVLQQIMIVFLQRIFQRPDINLSPFGFGVTHDLSWWAEMLKLENAIIVALACSYTFVQGGHVRVDLFYANVRFRTKKVVDMFGSLFFVLPAATLMWMYGWFFMWRHLVVPKPNASLDLDKIVLKARALRWNVETIGFSPNGFNAYWMFKALMVIFAGMVFLQGIAFFYRSLLEFIEGEKSEGKFLDKDTLGDPVAEKAAEVH